MNEVASSHADLIVTLNKATDHVTNDQVNAEIQKVWAQLQSDPEKRRAVALEAGVPEELLKSPAPPFVAGTPGSQHDFATAIAIYLGQAAIKSLIAGMMTTIWKNVIWPRIRKQFGADLEPPKDD